MTTPNWQHNSGKPPKRKLKPQALRAARERRRQLIKRLQTAQKRRFFSIIGLSNKKVHGS
tara:strand:- start:4775 stop:4954 length:180 start_codon:yes stop_codon:yes gene_type:complete